MSLFYFTSVHPTYSLATYLHQVIVKPFFSFFFFKTLYIFCPAETVTAVFTPFCRRDGRRYPRWKTVDVFFQQVIVIRGQEHGGQLNINLIFVVVSLLGATFADGCLYNVEVKTEKCLHQ